MFEATKDGRDASNRTGGHLVDEVKKMAHDFKADATDTANAAKNDLEGVARETGAQIRKFMGNTGHNLKEAGETVAGRIRENPIQSALIALGVGILAGIVYRR